MISTLCFLTVFSLRIDTMMKSTSVDSESSSDSMVHGKRLLPTWIDQVGRTTPEKPWALMPHSSHLEDGFREHQYRHLVAAIDSLAWWIESTIGRSTTFETVAYMGCLFACCAVSIQWG